MKNGFNILVMIVLAIYVISPVDLAPGPVDDMIMLLVYLIANRRKLMAKNVSGDQSLLPDSGSACNDENGPRG